MAEQPEKVPSAGSVQFLNPATLPQNPAYTNVVVVSGAVKTIYIGAQGAFDAATGTIVGKGDIGAQTTQVMKNIQAALEAVGAGLEHVIKWNIYIAQGQPLQPGFEASMRAWGNRPNPPLNTVMYVSQLVPSDFLVVIDAIAVVPL
ncbi:MAG: RidA family protein [Ktedonobacteraceae bacterium]|nr:RidA family protein [Ktedonobacteraceae bacterium]